MRTPFRHIAGVGFFLKLPHQLFTMKTFRLLVAVFVISFGIPSSVARAQCSESLAFQTFLTGNQSYVDSILLVGDLNSLTVNLDIVSNGGSYAGDLMVYLYAPNGACVVWGSWNVDPVGGCTNLGTGNGGAWPGGWNSSTDGFYTCLLYTSPSPRDLSTSRMPSSA